MSNTMNAAQRAGKHQSRLTWLRESPLLANLPGAGDDVDEAGHIALNQTLSYMKAAGLYSRTTAESAARWGIRLLVSEIRGQHVGECSHSSWNRLVRTMAAK